MPSLAEMRCLACFEPPSQGRATELGVCLEPWGIVAR